MRELTLPRGMFLRKAMSTAAVALMAMASSNVPAAEILSEPYTTLRIVETESTVAEATVAEATDAEATDAEATVAESSSTVPACGDHQTSVVIRNAAVRSKREVAAPRVAVGRVEIGAASRETLAMFPAEIAFPGDVSTRLHLDAANEPVLGSAASPAGLETEVRLRALPDSSRILAQPLGDGMALNTLRADEPSPPAELSVGWSPDTQTIVQPSTYVTAFTPRPNVLRMDAADQSPEDIRVASYEDGPPAEPLNQANESRRAEPRQCAFSASPLQPTTERLGPFDVTDQLEVLQLVERCGKVLRATRNVERTEVADPSVCAVVQFTPGELSIIGKQAGQTRVAFWFEGLQSPPITYLIHVVPNPLAR